MLCAGNVVESEVHGPNWFYTWQMYMCLIYFRCLFYTLKTSDILFFGG